MAKRDFNSGVLFVNDKKDDESDPDVTGKLFVGEVEHWFDGWRDGEVFNLRFRKKGTRGDNVGRGEIKKVDKSGKSDKYPDWNGKITTARGEKYKIAGWRKESEKVRHPFVSFSIEPISGNQQNSQQNNQQNSQGEPADETF